MSHKIYFQTLIITYCSQNSSFLFISTRNLRVDKMWSTMAKKWSNPKFQVERDLVPPGPLLVQAENALVLIFCKYFFRIFSNLLKQNFWHKILNRNQRVFLGWTTSRPGCTSYGKGRSTSGPLQDFQQILFIIYFL